MTRMKAPDHHEIDDELLAQRSSAAERLPTKGFYYVPTPAGVDAGLRSEDKAEFAARRTSAAVFMPEQAADGSGAPYQRGRPSPAGEAVTEGD